MAENPPASRHVGRPGVASANPVCQRNAMTDFASTTPLIIRADQARRSETPNAVMTTFASPTLGGSSLALWRVSMAPGSKGPLHRLTEDQILTVEGGGGELVIEGDLHAVRAGDTVVLPANCMRQVLANAATGLEAVVVAKAGARAVLADGTDRGVPPWVA